MPALPIYLGGMYTSAKQFAGLVPLPDLVIYLRQDAALLVQRTLARGHWRLQTGAPGAVERFIATALTTFEHLVQMPAIARQLVIVQGQAQGLAVQPTAGGVKSAKWFLPILNKGVAAVNYDYSQN